MQGMSRADVIERIIAANGNEKALRTQIDAMNNALLAQIARNVFGYRASASKEDRAKLVGKAKSLIIAIRKNKCEPEHLEWLPFILAVDEGIKPIEKMRASYQNQMEKLAVHLPAISFCRTIEGFGLMSFARIVGEAGDLARWKNIDVLHNRLGLGTYRGSSGCELRKLKTGKLSKDDWTEFGYSPQRRSVMFNIQEALVKHQLIAATKTEDGVRGAKGPYGLVYIRRREHTKISHPEWTDGHANTDAKRIMVKALVKDLYHRWKVEVALERGATETRGAAEHAGHAPGVHIAAEASA